MKNLQESLKALIVFLFFMLLFSSCNNEEMFVEQASIVEEEVPIDETEEDGNTEDEIVPVDVVDDTVNTIENIPVELSVFTNDASLPNVGSISNTDPSNGTLSINDNGTADNDNDDVITYIPQDGFFGTDSFEYTVCDVLDSNNCDTALVTITVEPREEDIATELKAFPDAYGAGAGVTGGRGGQVIHVTNLNDSGAGSLRDALSKTYPRIIVFDVSGEINNLSSLSVGSGNFTIAGQTAPQGGITITGERIYISFTDNWIIRYIRFRNGKKGSNIYERDCITAPQCSDIIIDHCSFAFASDEGLDFDSSEADGNITVQNCLFYENKTGMLIGSDPDDVFTSGEGEMSILRNVFSNVSHRFPNPSGSIKIDIINNLVHNWRYRTINLQARSSAENPDVNVVGNYFQSGPSTIFNKYIGNAGQGIHKVGIGDGNSNPQIYSRHNHIDQDVLDAYNLTSYNENTDESSAWSIYNAEFMDPISSSFFASSQLPLQGVAPTILANSSLHTELLPQVGASAYLNADGTKGFYRDAHDVEAVALAKDDGSTTRNGTGLSKPELYFAEQRESAVIPTTPNNTRPAGYDTDGDGMADIWETAMFGKDLTLKDGKADTDGDGYTDLEEFLNLIDK